MLNIFIIVIMSPSTSSGQALSKDKLVEGLRVTGVEKAINPIFVFMVLNALSVPEFFLPKGLPPQTN